MRENKELNRKKEKSVKYANPKFSERKQAWVFPVLVPRERTYLKYNIIENDGWLNYGNIAECPIQVKPVLVGVR